MDHLAPASYRAAVEPHDPRRIPPPRSLPRPWSASSSFDRPPPITRSTPRRARAFRPGARTRDLRWPPPFRPAPAQDVGALQRARSARPAPPIADPRAAPLPTRRANRQRRSTTLRHYRPSSGGLSCAHGHDTAGARATDRRGACRPPRSHHGCPLRLRVRRSRRKVRCRHGGCTLGGPATARRARARPRRGLRVPTPSLRSIQKVRVSGHQLLYSSLSTPRGIRCASLPSSLG